MGEFNPASILVTTDLSPCAAAAYPAARSLALAYGATLTLITCLDFSSYLSESAATADFPAVSLPEVITALKHRANEDLKGMLLAHFEGMAARHVVREGAQPPHHSLIEYIHQGGTDLVVIASHGRTGLSRAFLGSVAEQVVRHSRAPTLVIPAA